MNFKEQPLSNILEINPRMVLKKGTITKKIAMEHLNENIKRIKGYELAEFKSGSKFKNQDTLVARITPCLENGKTAFVNILDENEVAFGSTEFFVVRAKEGKGDPQFIYYLMRHPEVREAAIKSMTGTSGRQRAQKEAILDYSMSLPNIIEQKKIGYILSLFDSKIEENNDIIRNLEQFSQTLFKHWFIDFEFPNEEGQPYKSSGGKMVESELGEIPKDWVICKAGNILEFSPIEKIAKNKTATFVEMKNLNTSAMVYDYIQKPFKSGSKFRNGDTLLARITPCLENGKIGFVDFLNENEVGWGSTEFITIRTKNNIASSFSYYFASEQNFKNYAIKNMNGSSGRQRVKAETLINYLIAIPPNELIKKFTDISEPNMQMMTKLKEETLILRKVRDTLLPKLLSGEIEIPDELEV